MQLTSDQVKLFETWIRQKFEQPHCPMCQGIQWRIGKLIQPVTESVFDDETEANMVQMICKNCGNVLLFDVHTIDGWHARSPHSSAWWVM